MGTILNGKYLSMPEQVQKNKNDIEVINQYLQNVYKTSSTLTEDTTSINIEDTDIDINNLNFALLIDRQGHIYKIIDVIGEVVYLSFLTNIPSGTEYNFTGEWVSDNNEYYVNDLVLYKGNLYLCEENVNNSNISPDKDITHWSLFLGFGSLIGDFITSLYEDASNSIYFLNSKFTLSGIVFETINGIVKANGVSTSTYWRVIPLGENLKPGRYAYKMFQSGIKPSSRGWDLVTIQNTTISLPNAEEGFITINDEVKSIRIYMDQGFSFDNYEIKPVFIKNATSIPQEFIEGNGNIIFSKELKPIEFFNGSLTQENSVNIDITTNRILLDITMYQTRFTTQYILGNSTGVVNITGISASNNYNETFKVIFTYDVSNKILTFVGAYVNDVKQDSSYTSIKLNKVLGYNY